ncbi:MAG: hypothetical protein LUC90_02675 [Lachnospiraceae bacterium]|nr:hypothetical protein [Lachnospiraceae bacterium]
MCNGQNLETRRQQRSQLTGQVQETANASKYYVHPQMTDQYLSQDTRNAHMQKFHIKSVRDAVMQVMGEEAYQAIDALRSEEQIDMRKTKLHHSRGTRLAAEGNDILELDIAGSSFKQFRSEHHGVKGKRDVEDYLVNTNVHWYNKIFGWMPGVKSAKKLKKEVLNSAITSAQDKQDLLRQAAAPGQIEYTHNENIARRYGKAQRVSGKKRKHIRKAVSLNKNDKTRITMAGPLGLGGMSNSGDYSIENLREYIMQMGVDYIQHTMMSPAWINNPHVIWLRIRGHSRGGVACMEGAMMIKKWAQDNIPLLQDFVKFDVTQFDPVPGFGSETGTHKKVDMTGDNNIRDGKAEMSPLGDSAETTVVYSIHSDHSHFFTPQEVANTKRVILTPYPHSVGLGVQDRQKSSQQRVNPQEVGQQETTQQETDQEMTAHRAAFTDAATGDAYRLSSLNELPEGLYMLDEHNTLVQIKSEDQLTRIMDKVLANTSGQKSRHQVIKNVAEEWFKNH